MQVSTNLGTRKMKSYLSDYSLGSRDADLDYENSNKSKLYLFLFRQRIAVSGLRLCLRLPGER